LTGRVEGKGRKRAAKTQKSLCDFCVLAALKTFFAPVQEVRKRGECACKRFTKQIAALQGETFQKITETTILR
jgi:hypothetical protein